VLSCTGVSLRRVATRSLQDHAARRKLTVAHDRQKQHVASQASGLALEFK
jgi:hypothetical protein